MKFAPIVSAVLLAAGCSNAPPPPAKGTPAFSWGAAKENQAAGDYAKTVEHLGLVTKTDNEFSGKARPWHLVLTAGLTEGYMELGETFEYGARANKANPSQFRRRTSDYRSMASRTALQFFEAFTAFEKKLQEDQVPVYFGELRGSTLQPPALTRIANGETLPDSQIETVQKAVLERGILLAAGRMVDSDDPSRTRELLKGENARVPRATFLKGAAETLYKISDLFGPRKLDLPDRRQFFLKQALSSVSALEETKELKEFKKKIDADLKKIKART
ncbi:MAG: hypothetical protein ACKV22_26715 [Bryobacteraceae bacterium]